MFLGTAKNLPNLKLHLRGLGPNAQLHPTYVSVPQCIRSIYLDPHWFRYALRRQGHSACVELRRGLEYLAKLDHLTPVQQGSKTTFEKELEEESAVRAKVQSNEFYISDDLLGSGELPWDVAAKAVYDKTAPGKPMATKPSCVSSLLHRCLERGKDCTDQYVSI